MVELVLKRATISFGGPPLLERVDLAVEPSERLGLLGRNGSGKSTLLRVLAGELVLDEGELALRQGVRIASVPQEVPKQLAGTVAELLARELPAEIADWEARSRIGRVTSELALEPGLSVAELSAGSKRRVLLARALVVEPDVLLLDEPTNHLDFEAIRGLEDLLLRRSGSLVFVTHDRAFLQRLATRIVDIDRGVLANYECGYETYLERRDALLDAEVEENAQFDKKLAREEAWLRRGVKARRTRNMGRVRALRDLRVQRSERREETGRVRARVQEADRSGQVVVRAKGLTHAFDGKPLLRDVSCEIQRGDRVGILGPNGCGKTTLLQLLLRELEPDAGTVHHGTNLAVARFDQLHAVLDDTKTLQENVCDDGDHVTIGGVQRHVMGYLGDFLFTPEAIRGSIERLSGGERNRLQLAKVLARPCNLLVLDEPTNDLDLETLELLEELLSDFQGTLLLVSHDRAFLDNVVTSTLVFTGEGKITESLGGRDEWERLLARKNEARAQPAPKEKPRAARVERPRKLSFQEKKELEALPARIEALEDEKGRVETELADPALYKGDGAAVAATTKRFEELGIQLEVAYARWEELEALG